MDRNTNSQFPKPWKPIKGCYKQEKYSGKYHFNGKDAGAVAATTISLQPFIIAISGGIESLSYAMEPELYAGGASLFSFSFLFRWFWQTVTVASMKAIACWLRNYGESFGHNLGAWLWSFAFSSFWDYIKESLFSLLPWRRRRRRRPVPPDGNEKPSRRQPVRDWIKKRRQNR